MALLFFKAMQRAVPSNGDSLFFISGLPANDPSEGPAVGGAEQQNKIGRER